MFHGIIKHRRNELVPYLSFRESYHTDSDMIQSRITCSPFEDGFYLGPHGKRTALALKEHRRVAYRDMNESCLVTDEIYLESFDYCDELYAPLLKLL